VNLQHEKSSYVISIVALCFSAVGAAWGFVGGACCGWAAWPFAFVGLVLAIIALILRPRALSWWALGLSIFAFAWVIFGFVDLSKQGERPASPAPTPYSTP
jgi:hypothetical protein